MGKILLYALGLAMLLAQTSLVSGQPYFVRGEFNGWGTDHPMSDLGGGHYALAVSGQTPFSMTQYKLADAGWTQDWPGSDGKIQFDAGGSATFHLWRNEPFVDGWSPSSYSRVGYDYNGHGWDVMGSFNDWSSPVVTLSDLGGGLFQGDYAIPNAGTYDFKFRKADDWAISIGDNFGNAAANNQVTTTEPGETVRFELDLPNGRWRAAPVPEPAGAALLGLGAIALSRRRSNRG